MCGLCATFSYVFVSSVWADKRRVYQQTASAVPQLNPNARPNPNPKNPNATDNETQTHSKELKVNSCIYILVLATSRLTFERL